MKKRMMCINSSAMKDDRGMWLPNLSYYLKAGKVYVVELCSDSREIKVFNPENNVDYIVCYACRFVDVSDNDPL